MESHLIHLLDKAKTLASRGKTKKAIALLKESPYATFLGNGWDRYAFKISPRNKPSIVIKIDTQKSGHGQTEKEIHISCNFVHQYLPEVFDYDKGSNPRWITMEYLRPLKLSEPMVDDWQVIEFAKFIDASEDEFFAEHHWGMSRDGQVKVLDFGS